MRASEGTPTADFDPTIEHTALAWETAYEARSRHWVKQQMILEEASRESKNGVASVSGPAGTVGILEHGQWRGLSLPAKSKRVEGSLRRAGEILGGEDHPSAPQSAR